MFNGKKIDKILEEIDGLKGNMADLITLHSRLEAKSYAYEKHTQTNESLLKMITKLKKVAISKDKEIEKLKKQLEKAPKRRKHRKSLLPRASYKKVTPEEVEEMKLLAGRGLSILEIANTMGRSQSTVSQHLRDFMEGDTDGKNKDS